MDGFEVYLTIAVAGNQMYLQMNREAQRKDKSRAILYKKTFTQRDGCEKTSREKKDICHRAQQSWTPQPSAVTVTQSFPPTA